MNYFALVSQKCAFAGLGDNDYFNQLSITTREAYRAQFDDVRDEIAIGGFQMEVARFLYPAGFRTQHNAPANVSPSLRKRLP